MSQDDERDLLPGDEAYSGSFDDALGAAIATALAPYAPDPEEFEAGVRQRIEDGARRPAQLSPWVRNAAAFFPPILLPRSLADLGLATGSTALKQGGWKLLPGLIALPALVLLGAVSSFVLVVKRARIGAEQRTDIEDTREEMRGWRTTLVLFLVLAFASRSLAQVFGGPDLVQDVAVATLSISMLALVAIVGALSRARLASRAVVGQLCSSLLAFLVITSVLWNVSSRESLWHWLLPAAAMTAGAFYCGHLARRSEGADQLEAEAKKQRGTPTRPERLFALLHVLVAVGVFVGMQILDGRVTTTSAAREYLESGFTSSTRDFDWESDELVEAALHLESAGEEAADTTRLSRAIRESLSAEGADPSPLSFWSAGLAGLLSAEELGRFRDEDGERRLLKDNGPLFHPRHDCLPILARLSAEGWSEAERSHIAERLVLDLGERSGESARELWCRVLLLDRLGRGELARELAQRSDALLSALWITNPSRTEGFFASHPERVAELQEKPRRLAFRSAGDLRQSALAVNLVARFGTPAEADLDLLDGYLAGWARRGLSSEGADHVLAAASLAHLRALRGQQGGPSPWSLPRLLDFRLAFALVLLSVACVVITLRAPASESA